MAPTSMATWCLGTTTVTRTSICGFLPLAERTSSLPVRTVPGCTPALEAVTFSVTDLPVARSPPAGVTASQLCAGSVTTV